MSKTNIIKALINLYNNPIKKVSSFYKSTNRINGVGESLEYYVKDLFCNSINEKDRASKDKIHAKYFSYLGNQNNPPDVMIKDGDAIEIKKIEGLKSQIALNSSYPKNKLFSNSSMITKACRECEDWNERDLLYVIGTVINGELKKLWFIYGDCFCAEKEVYEKIKEKISNGLLDISDIDFSETKELGRVNRVDPLGITCFRIRGMWHIEGPLSVFDYLEDNISKDDFEVNAIILEDKYNTMPKEDIKSIETIQNERLNIKNIEIKSPNNPAMFLKAKLIQIKL